MAEYLNQFPINFTSQDVLKYTQPGTFTVTKSGKYRIEVFGCRGGRGGNVNQSSQSWREDVGTIYYTGYSSGGSGGRGAKVSFILEMNEYTPINLSCSSSVYDAPTVDLNGSASAGGGGASSKFTINNTLIAEAGGGGGGGSGYVDSIVPPPYWQAINGIDGTAGTPRLIPNGGEGATGVNPETGYITIRLQNEPPTKPTNFSYGEPRVSVSNKISWRASTDPEGDTITYTLERRYDSGAWVILANTQLAEYSDTIPRTITALKVTYRVKAIDSLGGESDYVVGETKTIIQNALPTLSISNQNVGIKNGPFPIAYTVNDEDLGNRLTITEELNGKSLRRITDATRGQTYTALIPDGDWLQLTNGTHTLKITVDDNSGATTTATITFTRRVVRVVVSLVPINTDATPAGKISISAYTVASDSAIKIEACNNALDKNPAWEDMTADYLSRHNHVFINRAKTAEDYAINVRITLDSGGAPVELRHFSALFGV